VRATWVGRWVDSRKSSQSTNSEFLQPPTDTQLVLADFVSQLCSDKKAATSDFPHFTDTVSNPSYCCQYISLL